MASAELSTKVRADAGQKRIVGACFVELESLTDLARLSCAFERAPFPIFMSNEGSKYRLAVQTDLFMGIPIFYHIEVEKGGEFLAYKSSGEVEDAQLVEAAVNPSYMYAPIVHVLKLPRVLERRHGFKARFLAAQVSDLANLMKIASYKMLYEEPPPGFVRYSASKLGDTDFSKRIDEHGSIYVKVVRLKEKHPLVEFK